MCLFLLATGERVVVGADLTAASLELAADAARRFGVDRALFGGDRSEIAGAWWRESFDVVYCSACIHHRPIRAASFAAVTALAKPGGVVVVGLYNANRAAAPPVASGPSAIDRLQMDPARIPCSTIAPPSPSGARRGCGTSTIHPEEHRHTIAEVKRWFRETDVEFLRTFPSALIAAPPVEGNELFTPATDDWWFDDPALPAWLVGDARTRGRPFRCDRPAQTGRVVANRKRATW